MMATQNANGGTSGIQIAQEGGAAGCHSASHSPAIAIAPALFTTEQAALYFGVSEAKFHEMRGEAWMCAPILLGPRLVRWARQDLDQAISAMPRQVGRSGEPTQLLRAKVERLKSAGASV